jgi:hypothetical protein
MIIDHNNPQTDEICVGCGIHKSSWNGNNGRGYLKGEERYCCRDCTELIDCTCGLWPYIK